MADTDELPQPWIRWKGSEQPVADGDVVEVMFATRRTSVGPAGRFGRLYEGKEIGWRRVGDRHDIIAYRTSTVSQP